MRTQIATKSVVGGEDRYVTATVPRSSGDGTTTPVFKLISFNTRINRRGFITALGSAWAAGGDGFVTFRLVVNGALIFPYDGSQSQWAVPSLMTDIPERIEVPPGALVEIQVDNSDSGNDYSVTGRVWMEYEPI